eukprot:9281457-Ditylum_brightwellii.AAC.1
MKGGEDREKDIEDAEGARQDEEGIVSMEDTLSVEERGEGMMEDIYDEVEEKDSEYEYKTIANHNFQQNILTLKVKYYNEM